MAKISKRWRYKVLHRWNVLISRMRRKKEDHFPKVIGVRACMIDLIYSLAANARERLRRQICVNPLVWFFRSASILIKRNMLIVMLRLFRISSKYYFVSISNVKLVSFRANTSTKWSLTVINNIITFRLAFTHTHV